MSKLLGNVNSYTALKEGGGYCGMLVSSYSSFGAGVGTCWGGGEGGGSRLGSALTLCAKRGHLNDANMDFSWSTFRLMDS